MTCKRLLTALLTLCLVLSCTPCVFAEDALPTEGQCGDYVYWQYDTENNVLTITGTGEIWDYEYYNTNTAPWRGYYWRIEKAIIGEGITSIGEKAFSFMSNLAEVSLPSTLTAIEAGAFHSCSLTSLEIPDSVTRIGGRAFNSCNYLQSVKLPTSLKTIEGCAFNSCTALKSIILPGTLEVMEVGVFGGCSQLTEIDLEEGNTYFQVRDGVLFNADGTELIQAPGTLSGTYQVPSGVTEIGAYAFQGTSVEEVILSDGVTFLGSCAFYDCESLTNVVLSKSLETISDSVFHNTAITQLVIPENVQSMYSSISTIASNCPYLDKVIFLGDEPFYNSYNPAEAPPENLTIYYTSTAQGWEDTWQGCPTQKFTCTYTTTATCDDPGTDTFTCEALGLDYSRDVLALGHDMSIWNLEKTPGAGVKGQWELVCSRCDHTETQEIPALACENSSAIITSNISDQNYQTWTAVINSYLVENDLGYQRIEYTGEYVSVEQYSDTYALLSQKGIAVELPIFGGFYSDGTYNFLVFGQANPNEDNTVEVIRVVRYDLDWNRMDSASVYGNRIWLPFDAGTLRMAHNGDYLYIRTCDEGYAFSDGRHHQGSRQMLLHIPTMEILYTDMMGIVSHSFNHFILCDGETVVYMDHGDAYNTRGAVLRVWDDNRQLFEDVRLIVAHGQSGQNATGLSMGGLAMSESSYITAGNSIVQDGSVSFRGQRNIFVTATSRQDPSIKNTTTHWLTNYPDGSNVDVSTPHLVKLSDQKLVVLWTEGTTLRYAFLDGDGALISDIYSCTGALSDCAPILTEGKLLWYVTDGTALTFYELDPNATEAVTKIPSPQPEVTFTDVPQGAYYEKAVAWAVAQNITSGIGDGKFAPDRTCLREQVIAFLWRAAGRPEPASLENPFVDVKESDYFYKAVLWAAETGITKGVDETHFGPKEECTRAQVATFLWSALGRPTPSGNADSFTDVSAASYYYKAVAWAAETGVTMGTTPTTFSPNNSCTRSQIVAFLYRALK